MGTFNLSMVASRTPPSDVQASPNPDTVTNPKTNEVEKQTITKDGIEIDKSVAPKLVLDAPVGHMYTEMLNKELSLESMGAIVAAAEADVVVDAPNEHTGTVAVGPQGATMDTGKDSNGYIYIVNADTLESQALGEIANKFLDRKTKTPDMKLGLAMISEGNPTATVESLTRIIKACGAEVTYSQSGLIDMAKRMLGK